RVGAAATNQAGAGVTTKTTSLRFFGRPGPGGVIEAGVLEDVHITPDTPSNSLIIAAPAQTMDRLLSLVKELDRPAAAQSSVKIFTLKKADAVQTATLLQQLFLSSGASLLGARAAGGAGGAGGVLTGTAATPPTGL